MNKQCTNGITKLDIKLKNYYLKSKRNHVARNRLKLQACSSFVTKRCHLETNYFWLIASKEVASHILRTLTLAM